MAELCAFDARSVSATRFPRRAATPPRLLIALLAFSSPCSLAAVPLDLETAISIALRQNHALVRDAHAVNAAMLDVDDAENAFSLRVRPQVSVGRLDDTRIETYALSAVKRQPGGTLLDARIERSDFGSGPGTDYSRVVVGIDQPLFRNAGTLVNTAELYRAGSASLRAQRQQEIAKSAIAIAVVRTYHDVFRLERQLHTDEQALRRTELHHRLAAAREASGRTARVDTLRAELQIGQARLRLAGDREQLAVARENLANLLGLDLDQPLSIAPTLIVPEFHIPPLAEAVATAYRHRLEYAQAKAALQDAHHEKRIAERRLLPDIALVAEYSRYLSPPASPLGDLLNEDALFVGLRGGFDIDRNRDRNQVQRAEFAARATAEDVHIVEQGIAREVQLAILAYRSAQAGQETAERNRAVTDARLRLARRLFSSGRASGFEVTDAENAYFAAESELLAARSAVSVRGYEFARSLGLLVEPPRALLAVNDRRLQ